MPDFITHYSPAPDRYDRMQYAHVGTSGLQLPRIALGLWHNFGDLTPYGQMQQIVFTAFDHGIFHFDLANNYGPMYGAAERNFGHIMRESLRPYRDELIISTRPGSTCGRDRTAWAAVANTCSPASTSRSNGSAWTMWTFFYHHCPDPNTPLEETVGALETAVTSGRALYVGLSNYDGPLLEQAAQMLAERHVPFIINQNRYNIFDRTINAMGSRRRRASSARGSSRSRRLSRDCLRTGISTAFLPIAASGTTTGS